VAAVSVPTTPVPATTKVTVELDLADMLGIGHSLRALARKATTPEGTRAIYWRVGTEMITAAHKTIQRGPVKP
jgi:hypothetical protein